MRKIVSIVGPTASGKTNWAVQLAQAFNGAVINADSRQIYTEMNIGTGKPPLTSRGSPTSKEGQPLLEPLYYQGVEHYLFDIVRPDERYNVARYQEDAFAVIDQLLVLVGSGPAKLPILTGGTGLYVAAVTHNYQFRPDGRKSQKKGPPKYKVLQIGIDIPRQELYGRINARIQKMYEAGLKQEALQLYKKYGAHSVLSRTIGYQEWLPLIKAGSVLPKLYRNFPIKGVCPRSTHPLVGKNQPPLDQQIIRLIQRNARHYAKRQLTWFRHDPLTRWVKTYQQAQNLTQKFLRKVRPS